VDPNLLSLILYVPFVYVAVMGWHRYGGKLARVRWRPFFSRLATWHLSVTLGVYIIYAIVLAYHFPESEDLAARGCGQGLTTFDTQLLNSCRSYVHDSFAKWFPMTCVFFGAIGIAVLIQRLRGRSSRP
jgi:hypothetical protein